MKKFWLPMLLASAFVVSCSKEDAQPAPVDGTGTLVLTTSINDVTIPVVSKANTPLADFTGYWISLDGTVVDEMECPQDGKIESLAAGDYTVKLSNLRDDFIPAFDAPRYGGKAQATVTANKQTPVAIVLTQANAGVKFVYDASLEIAGLGSVVATMAQDGNSLVYDGADRNATGYFAPGEIVLTLKNGSETVTIGGNANKIYTVEAKEIWTITLKATATPNGLVVSAEVDATVTEKGDEIELDPSDKPGGIKLIAFNGLQWMDRNVGATSADFENEWSEAIGSFFQWGRSVPFGTSGYSTVSGPLSAAKAESEIGFIKKMSGDWLSSTDNTRWQTAAKQPCPEGFRMPTITDFRGIFTPSGILVNMYGAPVSKNIGGISGQYWGDKSHTVYGIMKVGSEDAYYMKWEYLNTASGKGYLKITRWEADETATFTDKDLIAVVAEFNALAATTGRLPSSEAKVFIGRNLLPER